MHQTLGSSSAGRRAIPLLIAGALALACGAEACGQAAAPAAKTPSAAGARSSSAHKSHLKGAKTVPEAVPMEQIRPPDPPRPDWPVNDKALPATVDWDGRNLSVSATNSSLDKILQEVSTATGVKVEGMKDDQRIYCSYGPAPARDVLLSLLDGSGYNVLMVGDRGEGTPRELVLTVKVRAAGGANQQAAPQANQSNEDEAAEEPEAPEQPEPVMRRPGTVPPPGPGRSPQQFLQEMQQRRQQLQDQQQNQPNPQGVPVQPPNNNN